MFQLQDGRTELWQWDINRAVRVSDPTVSEVHFCNKTDDCSLVVKVYANPTDSELYADIPNILLQSDFPIRVYAYCGEGYTKVERVFKVHSRTKPADYVYTETEVITVQTIEKRMDELEETFNSNIDKTVSDYLEENPPQVDLTGYATEEWVEGKGYLTEHQDISGKADREHTHSYNDLTDKPTIPSLDGLATEDYVDNAVKNVEVDLTGYATEKYVDDAIANIDIPESGGSGSDTYYLNFSGATTAEQPVTDLMAEFVTKYLESKDTGKGIGVYVKGTTGGWNTPVLGGLGSSVSFTTTLISASTGKYVNTVYTIKNSPTTGEKVYLITSSTSYDLATKEYVDGLFANIATAEGGSY